jgi:hypothetical protein
MALTFCMSLTLFAILSPNGLFGSGFRYQKQKGGVISSGFFSSSSLTAGKNLIASNNFLLFHKMACVRLYFHSLSFTLKK